METRQFGYVRVSSKDQNEARQISALIDFGISERDIYVDKESGKNFDRVQYQMMLNNIRKGDLVVFLSLDRMGRNYTEIKQQWQYITCTLGADIKVLDMELLDTGGENGSLDRKFMCDLILQILAYVAEKERANIRFRQAQGIREAKERNVRFGRPKIPYPDNWNNVYTRWKHSSLTATSAMQELGLKRSTFYALVKKYELR